MSYVYDDSRGLLLYPINWRQPHCAGEFHSCCARRNNDLSIDNRARAWMDTRIPILQRYHVKVVLFEVQVSKRPNRSIAIYWHRMVPRTYNKSTDIFSKFIAIFRVQLLWLLVLLRVFDGYCFSWLEFSKIKLPIYLHATHQQSGWFKVDWLLIESSFQCWLNQASNIHITHMIEPLIELMVDSLGWSSPPPPPQQLLG